MMRHALFLLLGGLRRSDGKAAVDLHGIGRDHFPAEQESQFDGKRRFAGSGGPHNRKHGDLFHETPLFVY